MNWNRKPTKWQFYLIIGVVFPIVIAPSFGDEFVKPAWIAYGIAVILVVVGVRIAKSRKNKSEL